MLPAEAKTPGQSITVTPLPQLTETPAWIDCPYCNQRTKTQVTSEGSSAQWYVFYGALLPLPISLTFSPSAPSVCNLSREETSLLTMRLATA